MSSPKTDDGGKLMNKCGGANYIGYNSGNGCQNPETLESIRCPIDRNGSSLYTCFNMSGEQTTSCRSTCLHGHLQDFGRTLYNKDTAGASPFYWEERGVELYENFGLSEIVRSGGGSYSLNYHDTFGNQLLDKNMMDQGQSYCSPNGYNGGKYPSCQNTCFTELGRKLTLFGQIGFTFIQDYGNPNGSYSGGNSYLPCGFVIPSTFDTTYSLAHGPNFYLINFYRTAPDLTTDYVDQYDYFGNSGVIIKDANGKQFYFIYGMNPFIINNGQKTSPTTTMMSHILYDNSNKSMIISIKYFNENASMVGLLCDAIQSVGTVRYDSCTNSDNLDGMNQPAVAFPLSSAAQVFCDAAYDSHGVQLADKPNCYYSGVRSMYIPPHMKVTGFTHQKYLGNAGTWNSSYGTVVTSLESKTGFKPFTYQDSPYKNGTFPSLGSDDPNSPKTDQGVYAKGGPYMNPAIYNCSLEGIWVDVRRDTKFRSIYIPDSSYNIDHVFPEIFLVPGIAKAQQFQANTTSTIQQLDPMQHILDPSLLWSDSNPNYNSSYSIELDLTKKPYDAVPVNPVVSAQATLAEVPSKILPKMLSQVSTQIGKFLSLPVTMHKKMLSLTAVSYSGKPYIGQGRIKSFMPANGIMSIEWIYVIYRCAFSYQPGQTNSITYDQTTKNYVFGDNSNSCGAECMLYRDPYLDGNTDAQTISASDIMMKTICGAKTYMMAFAQYSNPTANDCACVAAAGYCPSQFNTGCDPLNIGQNQHYISDQNTDQNCNSVCSYCNTVVIQVNVAKQNSNLTDGSNKADLGPTCAANPQCTGTTSNSNVNTDGSTNSTEPDPPPQKKDDTPVNKKRWALIIIMIILMIIAVIVIFAAAMKHFQKT